ncbi:hypothetical protein [Streptomyces sp. NPDC047868]|uniref:hypothetical protein n=1 Tax=Streptomyces sp. NPDC047868 TaxID=3155480 RepID=UPI0034560913
MGIGDDDTAATNLRLLETHFRQHPVTGPTERSAPTVKPSVPVDLDVVDHIRACVTEIVTDVRAVNASPGPMPERVTDVYTWYLDNTRTAGRFQQQRRDTIIYRQRLEHAIAMRDFTVIRPHRCPQCRTMGLMWRVELKRALCTNMRCLNEDGMSNAWTLARLAYEHIAERENIRQVSAT